MTKEPQIHVPKELIEHLEKVFKDRAPDLNDSVDKIRFKSGCVHVVRYIRQRFEEQFTRDTD